MKVFITGGAGFIGAHLTRRLLADNHKVIVLDNLSTGEMSNLEPFLKEPNFDYRIGDVSDRPLVQELVDRADVVVHLAAAVGVKLIVEQPVHTIETNVHGTEVVLWAAAKKQKPVLIASTSEVYGKATKFPFSETDDLVMGATAHSRWAYACSKALDEWLALAYYREKKVPTIICRFFNTVGPGQTGRYGMVLPNFAAQALKNEDITVYGTGDQSRCFGHVHDAVEAITRLLQTDKAYGEVFNVGATTEVSIYQLAEKIRDAAGSTSQIVKIPYEQAYAEGFEDMMRRIPDSTKLEATIGFKPETSLDQIIRDVIEDQRARLGL